MTMIHRNVLTVLIACLPGVVLPLPAFADTDWVLVLDRSESMTQNDPHDCRFDAQKIMVDLLSQGVEETHRLTIIRFAGTAEAVLEREVIRPQNLESIRKLIVQDPPMGDTDIAAALGLARRIVKPEGRAADVHLILMSDGVLAGKTPNLAGLLDEEKRVCQSLGLQVHSVLLNDYSISKQEREQRRKQKLYYEDKQLQSGEDLLRDVARKTGGAFAQVVPERGVEDILIELIAPHMSFHREPISPRLVTWPTDRQLYCVIDRASREVKIRMGTKEVDVNLDRQYTVEGDFELTVTPYRNRTVVLLKPSENVRWPDWIEFLPGRTGSPATGVVFVISNVRLEAIPGLGDEGLAGAEGVKTKIRENEVYPIRFRITVPSDITPERARSIQDTLKKSSVRIELSDSEGKLLDDKSLAATDVAAGAGNRLYFIPTSSPRGEAKVSEPFGLRLRARLEHADGSAGLRVGRRPLCRAPDRSLVVVPSTFEWVVRKNWKGDPVSNSRPATLRAVEVELGQEFRLEVVYSGQEPLGEAEMVASFGQAGESAARKLLLKDAGGVPRTFSSDWIFPTTTGNYEAKMSVKTGGVQEVAFTLSVLRDDFRLPGSQYTKEGTSSVEGQDLGSYFQGEKIAFGRQRTINRLTPQATSTYWESALAAAPRAFLLARDAASASWTIVRQVPIAHEVPVLGAAEIVVPYRGEISDLEPGQYIIAWPEKRTLGPDPLLDPRCDRFEVKPRAFAGGFSGNDGKALELDGGKPTMLAGTTLDFKVTPSKGFPESARSSATGILTWARKDVGAPQEVKALRGPDGIFTLSFPTTDFHTGAAKLHVVVKWTEGSRERVIEEDHEVFSRTKALGIAIEPVEEDILIGQKGAAIRFRLRAIGGQNAQAQRDLLSVWQSQPANVTIGDSEKIQHVELTLEGDALTGSLEADGLVPGAYKLIVSSPLAKLGQDIAACFFNVKPCPFAASVVKSSLGTDQRLILGPGVESASSEGEGAVWINVEAPGTVASGAPTAKIVAAELRVNGRKADVRWLDAEGKFRSEPISLESLEKQNALTLALSDEAGRNFELSIGSLEVIPVPLKYEVTWSRALPQELGRGERVRIEGMLVVRGGLKSQREEAGKDLVARPFLSTSPAGVLEGFEILPPPREEGAIEAVFGVRVGFAAVLNALASLDLKESFTLNMKSKDGELIETRKITIVPSALQVALSRAEGQESGPGAVVLPFTARERVKIKIEGQAPQRTSRIQVFPDDDGAAALAVADTFELVWSPKKEGVYRVRAEANLGTGMSWVAEEKVSVLPTIELAWSRDHGGTIKLDDGQKLPLSVKIVGPPSLEREAFDRYFVIRAEVLGEGSQQLNVDFTNWEADKSGQSGTLVLNCFSTKPLSGSAAKARVRLSDRSSGAGAVELDVLDVDIVRGGGSLVEIRGFEKGPSGYDPRDLPPDFLLPRDTSIRLGYRTGGMVESEDSLSKSVVAVISDGQHEKVLDVESVANGLVVFVPYTPAGFGRHTILLKISGKTPLQREFGFEVTQGTRERAYAWMLYAALGIACLGLLYLGGRSLRYLRDRGKVLERVNARKEKALGELEAEPTTSLSGNVRLTIANRSIGPLELNGNVSEAEVEAWVSDRFSMETTIFSDVRKNEKRLNMIKGVLTEARTQLCLETEKRLPIRGADICVAEKRDAEKGLSSLEAFIVHDSPARKSEGEKCLLSLRLQPDGKLRITTSSGRSVTVAPGEDFPYNGWIGKSGKQLKASVKVPGLPDYSTIFVDLN